MKPNAEPEKFHFFILMTFIWFCFCKSYWQKVIWQLASSFSIFSMSHKLIFYLSFQIIDFLIVGTLKCHSKEGWKVPPRRYFSNFMDKLLKTVTGPFYSQCTLQKWIKTCRKIWLNSSKSNFYLPKWQNDQFHKIQLWTKIILQCISYQFIDHNDE